MGKPMSDGEVIALAERLTHEQRIKIIERFASLGTEQGDRIARWLLDLHVQERAKGRHIVNWALGTTFH